MDDASIFVYDPTTECESSLVFESPDDNVIQSIDKSKEFDNKYKIVESDVMSSIQDAKHSLNYLEVQIMQKVNKESALRSLFAREIESIHSKIGSIIKMIHSLSSYPPNSQSSNHSYHDETSINLYINPSVPDISVFEELDIVSKELTSIEEHVKSFVTGFGPLTIPLSERLESLQYSLLQLLNRSQSLSKSFEKISIAYNSILKNSSFSLTRNDKMINVTQVYEKVVEIEPLLMMASSLQKKMEELMELSNSIQTLEVRVKQMECRQEELERLVQDSLNMVASVKSQMKNEIPELKKLADSLVQ